MRYKTVRFGAEAERKIKKKLFSYLIMCLVYMMIMWFGLGLTIIRDVPLAYMLILICMSITAIQVLEAKEYFYGTWLIRKLRE